MKNETLDKMQKAADAMRKPNTQTGGRTFKYAPGRSFNHAPGPWTAEYCGKDTIKIFKPSDKRRIATVKVKTAVLDEANARLLASSPEVLEALEKTAQCLIEYRQTGYMSSWDLALRDAVIALTNAKGE